MFGLTEEEMYVYRERTQEFVLTELIPNVLAESKFVAPVIRDSTGELVPDMRHVSGLTSDIGLVTTINALRMSQDYAQKQYEEEGESEIIEYLEDKYSNLIFNNLILYGVAFTEASVNHIINTIMLELPYLYAYSVETFDGGDTFLGERMDAYEDYVSKYLSREGEGENSGEEDEE